ncbi:MAG: nicotinate phosphoribosyltransferase [Candidatus Omnitrophota bacterium]
MFFPAPLSLDFYELTMCDAYLRYKKNTQATFDLFVRRLPKKRSFLVSAGLKDILEGINKLRFQEEDLGYLKSLGVFSRDFLAYLRGFKFSGDVWALPEGEIFFANEPVIRVSAPIIQAQILETMLLNIINLQTMIASKAARVVLAAQGRSVFDFSLRRTHGQEAGLKVARSSYLAGFAGTSNVLAGKIYKIPVAGTMAHSFVMSFNSELESFLAYTKSFPAKSILLVDTYSTRRGVNNSIKVALSMRGEGFKLAGIRLDSGDLVCLAKESRRLLDRAGLNYVKIFVSGNLDEIKINELLKKRINADAFGVGTNMGTSSDAPFLDVIYKVSEVSDSKGNFLPTMKLSRGKLTFPGRKQVFRIKDKKGNFLRDILALEGEGIKAKSLLVKVVDKGKVIYKIPSLIQSKGYARRNISNLPRSLRQMGPGKQYPVLVSPGLRRLKRRLVFKLSRAEFRNAKK